jgi:hypothetical protein
MSATDKAGNKLQKAGEPPHRSGSPTEVLSR